MRQEKMYRKGVSRRSASETQGGSPTKMAEIRAKRVSKMKNLESFVPWKETTLKQRGKESGPANQVKSVRASQKTGMSSCSLSNLAATALKLTTTSLAMATTPNGTGRSASAKLRKEASTMKEGQGVEQSSTDKRRLSTSAVNDDSRLIEGMASGQSSSRQVSRVPKLQEYPFRGVPSTKVASAAKEDVQMKAKVVQPNRQSSRTVFLEGSRSPVPSKITSVRQPLKNRNVEEPLHKFSSSPTACSLSASEEDDDKVMLRRREYVLGYASESQYYASVPEEDTQGYDRSGSRDLHMPPLRGLQLYDEQNEEDVLDISESQRNPYRPLNKEQLRSDDNNRIQETKLEDETTRRRQRRQAQALREKEGVKRKKEGLPMNFLLVDEYTMKPYGVGVGEWRKELMLLSSKLDPAVGNINQHPEGAVEELADWIQHTWEYSSPVKFAFVKEVIARGVTLRRVDLWKRIRNEEPKPEDVSDRSWRTLERQLQSPANIRKSENCSRANGSRQNFGRTGPSGEIGVRERLRRTLRRSPDPEEISFEMARDKGYGGQYKLKKDKLNVMHGPGGVGKYGASFPQISGPNDNSNKMGLLSFDNGENIVNLHDEGDADNRPDGPFDGSKDIEVHQLSAVEIVKHPLVRKMMECLEALEARQIDIEDSLSPSKAGKSIVNAEREEGGITGIDEEIAVSQTLEMEYKRQGTPFHKWSCDLERD